MKIYLVGGAVRDGLLGTPVKDRDFVVVGQTPEIMIDQGYKPVGKGFPVFLHPQTGDEYALARIERKTGKGHDGFSIVSDPTVTLEEDLSRRDLTINAIAQDLETGKLVDPYGGKADMDARILRHVSPAFIEDPLRILRVARFAARYAHLGFTVAPETMELLSCMVADDALSELPSERIWGEVSSALAGPTPSVFMQVLRQCGALAAIAPEVDALYGIPQVALHHPEIDTGIHTEMVVDQAARLAPGQVPVVFAALVHDLGKGLTPSDQLPQHINHEKNGLPPVEVISARWKVPTVCRELAVAVCEHHLNCHRAMELRPRALLNLLEATGAFRQASKFEPFLLACEADARGRAGLEDRDYPQTAYLRRVCEAAQAVNASSAIAAGKTGAEIGEAMRILRLEAISRVRSQKNAPDVPVSVPSSAPKPNF